MSGFAQNIKKNADGTVTATFKDGATAELLASDKSNGTTLSAPLVANGLVTVNAGLRFPATAALSTNVNTLDDYEEGTFAPSLTTSGGVFTTITYSLQTGVYTKIGRTVYFHLNIVATGITGQSGSAVRVAGMPFTAAAASIPFSIISGKLDYSAAGDTVPVAFTISGQTNVNMFKQEDALALSTVLGSVYNTAADPKDLYMWGFYETTV